MKIIYNWINKIIKLNRAKKHKYINGLSYSAMVLNNSYPKYKSENNRLFLFVLKMFLAAILTSCKVTKSCSRTPGRADEILTDVATLYLPQYFPNESNTAILHIKCLHNGIAYSTSLIGKCTTYISPYS